MKTPTTAFPLNAWYAAAYDVEVARKLLPRTLCKQKVVLFRKTDGTVAALSTFAGGKFIPCVPRKIFAPCGCRLQAHYGLQVR